MNCFEDEDELNEEARILDDNIEPEGQLTNELSSTVELETEEFDHSSTVSKNSAHCVVTQRIELVKRYEGSHPAYIPFGIAFEPRVMVQMCKVFEHLRLPGVYTYNSRFQATPYFIPKHFVESFTRESHCEVFFHLPPPVLPNKKRRMLPPTIHYPRPSVVPYRDFNIDLGLFRKTALDHPIILSSKISSLEAFGKDFLEKLRPTRYDFVSFQNMNKKYYCNCEGVTDLVKRKLAKIDPRTQLNKEQKEVFDAVCFFFTRPERTLTDLDLLKIYAERIAYIKFVGIQNDLSSQKDKEKKLQEHIDEYTLTLMEDQKRCCYPIINKNLCNVWDLKNKGIKVLPIDDDDKPRHKSVVEIYLLNGSAGTGKTFLLDAIHQSHHVIYTTIKGSLVQSVLTNFDTPGFTFCSLFCKIFGMNFYAYRKLAYRIETLNFQGIDWFLDKIDFQNYNFQLNWLPPYACIFLDEYSMVSASMFYFFYKTLSRYYECKTLNRKLLIVLAGDHNQIRPIFSVFKENCKVMEELCSRTFTLIQSKRMEDPVFVNILKELLTIDMKSMRAFLQASFSNVCNVDATLHYHYPVSSIDAYPLIEVLSFQERENTKMSFGEKLGGYEMFCLFQDPSVLSDESKSLYIGFGIDESDFPLPDDDDDYGETRNKKSKKNKPKQQQDETLEKKVKMENLFQKRSSNDNVENVFFGPNEKLFAAIRQCNCAYSFYTLDDEPARALNEAIEMIKENPTKKYSVYRIDKRREKNELSPKMLNKEIRHLHKLVEWWRRYKSVFCDQFIVMARTNAEIHRLNILIYMKCRTDIAKHFGYTDISIVNDALFTDEFNMANSASVYTETGPIPHPIPHSEPHAEPTDGPSSSSSSSSQIKSEPTARIHVVDHTAIQEPSDCISQLLLSPQPNLKQFTIKEEEEEKEEAIVDDGSGEKPADPDQHHTKDRATFLRFSKIYAYKNDVWVYHAPKKNEVQLYVLPLIVGMQYIVLQTIDLLRNGDTVYLLGFLEHATHPGLIVVTELDQVVILYPAKFQMRLFKEWDLYGYPLAMGAASNVFNSQGKTYKHKNIYLDLQNCSRNEVFVALSRPQEMHQISKILY